MVIGDEGNKKSPPLVFDVQTGGRRRLLRNVSRRKGALDKELEDSNWIAALHEEVVQVRELLTNSGNGIAQEKIGVHRSLLLDLLLFLDRMDRMYKENKIPSCDRGPQDVPQLLRFLSEELIAILYRCDVHPIRTSSTTVDERMQRVVEVVPTQKMEQNGTICSIVRHGFWYGKEILRQEEIAVYRYEEPKEFGESDTPEKHREPKEIEEGSSSS